MVRDPEAPAAATGLGTGAGGTGRVVGWSLACEAMKVRRGERDWEAGLAPSLLGGGEPQAKLCKVGRGRGCARLGEGVGPRDPGHGAQPCLGG